MLFRSALTLRDITKPLVKIHPDSSKGNNLTARKIYAYMEDEYNIDWTRWTKRYVKENGVNPKSKSEIVCSNHGLMERFRQSVIDMVKAA